MDITQLTDDELLTRVEKSAKCERLASARLIQDLAEVDRRLLYAKYGFDSLFRFCVKKLKMSDAQAGRRVNAARLLQVIPRIKGQIETGEVTITVASQLQSYCRREQRAGNHLSNKRKEEILEQVKSKSTRDVEKILAAHASRLVSLPKDREKTLTPDFTELRLIADNETMAGIKRLREIWSHGTGTEGLSAIFKKMVKICVEACDPEQKAARATKRRANVNLAKTAKAEKKNPKLAEPKARALSISGDLISKTPVASQMPGASKTPDAPYVKRASAIDGGSSAADAALDSHLQMDIEEWLEGRERTQNQEAVSFAMNEFGATSQRSAPAVKRQSCSRVTLPPPSAAAAKQQICTPAAKSDFEELRMGNGGANGLGAISKNTIPKGEVIVEEQDCREDVRSKNETLMRSQVGAQAKPSRYIPAGIRQEVWMRDGGCCSFRQPLSGEKCESRIRIQYDHIVPFAMGGTHNVANIRLLCHRHNQWHAIQSYGPNKILRFSKDVSNGIHGKPIRH